MNEENNNEKPAKELWDLNWYFRYPIAILILIATFFLFGWLQGNLSNNEKWLPWVISGCFVLLALRIAFEAGCIAGIAMIGFAIYAASQALGYFVPDTISDSISVWSKQYSWLFFVILFVYFEYQKNKQHEELNKAISRLHERIYKLEQQNYRNLEG